MSKSALQQVEDAFDSLTRLARPGDWPRATDELEDTTTFAEGVIDEPIVHYYPMRDDHCTSSGWTIYRGTDDADYDYYFVSNDPGMSLSWKVYGCNEDDYAVIRQSFEQNPFLLEANESTLEARERSDTP